MTTQFESGHAKNVANLEDLISFCQGFGAAYNPAAANIKITALQALGVNTRAAISNTTSTFTAFKNATNARELGFAALRKLSTRVVNSLDACGVTQQTLKDAKTIDRKIKGKSASSRSAAAPPESVDPSVPPVQHHSTSQQSFDSLLQHLSGMIQLVSTEPLYLPNENDLKVTGLNAYLAALQAKNTACINTYTAYSNARLTRNTLLYDQNTGLTHVAQEVKKYVKSVFGAASPQYKQISGIRFTTGR